MVVMEGMDERGNGRNELRREEIREKRKAGVLRRGSRDSEARMEGIGKAGREKGRKNRKDGKRMGRRAGRGWETEALLDLLSLLTLFTFPTTCYYHVPLAHCTLRVFPFTFVPLFSFFSLTHVSVSRPCSFSPSSCTHHLLHLCVPFLLSIFQHHLFSSSFK